MEAVARRALRTTALALLLGIAWPAVAQETARETTSAAPQPGDRIVVEGTVVDPSGEPLADVQVLLEVSRERFSLRRMGRVEGEPLRLPARTGDDGRFAVDWTWDPHYNRFELAVGLEKKGGGFEILERRDLTSAMKTGRVPEQQVVVENAGFLRWLGAYLDGRASDDEIEIYRERGRPDEVRPSEHFPDETTWWYFAAGKSYRFVGGALERVVHFEPIPDPPPAAG